MDKKEKNVSRGGIGFAGLLTLVFIVLKLCGVIAWSWWWVLAPVWITVAIYIITLVVVMVVAWRRGLFEE